jgi:phosphate transport system substrate-binding protein
MRLRLFFLPTVLSVLLIVACSSKPGNKEAGSGENTTHITGAGSTFVYPIMTRWVDQFTQDKKGLQINYQSIGSGGGIQQLKEGVVDFGASDMALDDQKLKEMPPLVQVPESAGPVAITYNLSELKEPLKLSGPVLADIYMGKIKNWQDGQIRRDNPGVKLPHEDIVVVHRSDGSGTSNIFTTYLAAVSPQWEKEVGKGLSVKWPLGLGGKGSEGVTGMVKQSPGAIGYVELSYAIENNLPMAEMENRAGKFITPSADSTSAAIDAFSSELAKDVRDPIVNPPASAKDAYPISGLTFLLVPKTPKSTQKGAEVKNFVDYIITGGQSMADQLHYAKLPDSLQQIDKHLLEEVQG